MIQFFGRNATICMLYFQLIAAPFAAGTLYFDPPWAYICQIPSYLFGKWSLVHLVASLTCNLSVMSLDTIKGSSCFIEPEALPSLLSTGLIPGTD